MTAAVYKRILLKISGEALAGPQGFGIDPDRAEEIACKIQTIHKNIIGDMERGVYNKRATYCVSNANHR